MENYLKEERNTKSYKDKMNIDIEILTRLKRKTKYIQNYGGISTKLYNKIFKGN